MADKQVNELTSLSVMVSGDYIPVFDRSEAGGEKLKKVTFSNFRANLTIKENTTIYVSTTGSDTTGIGTSGSPFATVNGALDYLKDKFISTDVSVTIQLADGTYSSHAVIEPSHPCGNNITIKGENTYSKSLTSVQSSSGSAGAWSVILNLNNVTNIAVNDYVLIPYSVTGGTHPLLLAGCWKITNVDSGNSRITITNTVNYSSISSGATTATVTIIKSMLSFATNANGIEPAFACSINLEDLVLVGDGSTNINGIYADSSKVKVIDNVGINGFGYGCQSNGSALIYGFLGTNSTSIYVSNCFNQGVYVRGGSVFNARYCVISGCDSHGLYILSSLADVRYAVIVSNFTGSTGWGIYNVGGTIYGAFCSLWYNVHGIVADSSINIMTNTTARYNSGNGFHSQHGASMYAVGSTSSNNTGWGFYAAFTAYLAAASYTATGNGNGNFSPNANTQGNEFAYINT